MNLFIDTISTISVIIIFDENREIIERKNLNIKGNESSSLIPEIDNILKNNNLSYKDLINIVVVNGPGSFTGVRTSVLAVNSINYIIDKNITAISYFKMFNSYPIVKSSSKRDCFLQLDANSSVEIISNEDLLNLFNKKSINKIHGEANSDSFSNIEIFGEIDYINIIKQITFDDKKQIDPLYIKKPNIS